MSDPSDSPSNTELVGLIAQFDDPGSLLHAGEHARDAGYKRMDAYTPFPIHGMERALGIPRTVLPFIVLAIGISGCFGGLALQWFVNGTENVGPWSGYQFMISGKPLFSLPANIPVTFEITVLSSAFAAFFGMFILNKMPRLANPLHRVPRFMRATNDRFFLMIEAGDEKFDLQATKEQLEQWGASEVEEVREDMTDQQMPAFVKTVCILLVLLLAVPPVLIYRARGAVSRNTRLHVVPDMDFQVKYKPQNFGPKTDFSRWEPQFFFADKRAAREPIAGTIARGQLMTDTEYYFGIKQDSSHAANELSAATQFVSATDQDPAAQDPAPQDPAPQDPAPQDPAPQDPTGETVPPAEPEPDWVTEFPAQVPINGDTIDRGQRMFGIYCSACHGYAGDGDGLVNQRALALAAIDSTKAAWTQAKSFYDPEIVKQPVGRIFDTITNGRATMGPYRSRVEVADRWAIVLYIKTLQEIRKDVPFVAPGTEEGSSSASSGTPAN